MKYIVWDIIGFNYPNFGFFDSRNASECIRLVSENCKYVVAGNHDFYSIRRLPQHDAGFRYPSNWYELDYREKKKLAGDQVWVMEEVEFDPLISSSEKNYLANLPEYLSVEVGTSAVLISHYLYPDLPGLHAQFYHNFGPVEDHLEFIRSRSCSIGFSGHKHIEGAMLFIGGKSRHIPFGVVQLQEQLQWIVGPCIANGKKQNGCMVYDTVNNILEIIPLGTPPRMMQTVYV